MQKKQHIFKIGGSCLHEPADLEKVAGLCKENPDAIIVISAFNELEWMLTNAAYASVREKRLDENITAYLTKFYKVFTDKRKDELQNCIEPLLKWLDDELSTISSQRYLTNLSLAAIQAISQLITANLLFAYLKEKFINATLFRENILRVKNHVSDKAYLDEENKEMLIETLGIPGIKIVPGTVGTTKNDVIVSLGKDGADYTATFISSLFPNSEVTFFTNQQGIFTADPKIVTNAELIPEISIQQAIVIARAGSTIVSERALEVIKGTTTKIRICNLRKRNSGTIIKHTSQTNENGKNEPLIICSKKISRDMFEIVCVGPTEIILGKLAHRLDYSRTLEIIHDTAKQGQEAVRRLQTIRIL